MNIARKCNYVSNSYYNIALEMAGERNLSDAILNLKRSLQFNKTNTDARNLLGLIYHEMGEEGDALVQWIISQNLNPEHNSASDYIDDVELIYLVDHTEYSGAGEDTAFPYWKLSSGGNSYYYAAFSE